MAVHLAGRAKPSVSSHDDSFVTPQRTRQAKKTVITFSSDEEDEEGECHSTAAFNLPFLVQGRGRPFGRFLSQDQPVVNGCCHVTKDGKYQ